MQIEKLHGNPGNPRTITDKKLKLLKNSLEKFGDLGGFVFNKTSQMLVGGHQRAKIFDKTAEIVLETEYEPATRTGTVSEGYVVLKGERFKYREVEWDDATEKAANIAANKGAGEWDPLKLTEWFSELNDLNFDLDLTMFDETERIKFLKEPVNEGLCDEDEVPEVVEPKTKPGDLYKLGNHRVLCGDSTNVQHVERLMGGDKADMVFTDPPYGIDEATDRVEHVKTFKNQGVAKKGSYSKIVGDTSIDTAVTVFNLIEGLAIPTVAYWGGNYYANDLPNSPCWVVWDKRVEDNQRDLNSDCELAWVKHPHKASVRIFRHLWKGMIKGSENGDARCHPTQKPIALAEWCFGELDPKGTAVLDLFLGSGSTLIACEKTNRKCYGMEIDPHYCDVIIARWEKFTGLKAELLPDHTQEHKHA